MTTIVKTDTELLRTAATCIDHWAAENPGKTTDADGLLLRYPHLKDVYGSIDSARANVAAYLARKIKAANPTIERKERGKYRALKPKGVKLPEQKTPDPAPEPAKAETHPLQFEEERRATILALEWQEPVTDPWGTLLTFLEANRADFEANPNRLAYVTGLEDSMPKGFRLGLVYEEVV